jgi:hypothetical protein
MEQLNVTTFAVAIGFGLRSTDTWHGTDTGSDLFGRME